MIQCPVTRGTCIHRSVPPTTMCLRQLTPHDDHHVLLCHLSTYPLHCMTVTNTSLECTHHKFHRMSCSMTHLTPPARASMGASGLQHTALLSQAVIDCARFKQQFRDLPLFQVDFNSVEINCVSRLKPVKLTMNITTITTTTAIGTRAMRHSKVRMQ